MSKLKRLKSFSDYKQDMGNTPKSTPVPLVSERNLHKSVVTKQRMVKESAFKVGDDYKVKVTFDIPVSLISAYIEKVQSETGKNALEHFNETELAEQMAQYILKQHLNIDQIPSALSVGEDPNSSESTEAQEENDATDLGAEFGDTPSGETAEPGIEETPSTDTPSNIDINDSDLNIDKEEDGEDISLEDDNKEEVGEDIPLEDETSEEPESETKEDQDEKEINLKSDEVNLGEEREIEANKIEEQEEEYEEINLDVDTIGDTTGVLNSVTMATKDMLFYLKHHGIDCTDCTAKDVVDIYNEISKEYTIGIDDDGNEIKPSHKEDSDFNDSDLY